MPYTVDDINKAADYAAECAVLAEREACAKIADICIKSTDDAYDEYDNGHDSACEIIAGLIRARK